MIETIATFTPLGIRFWDPALDKQVGDNLVVRAFPGSGRGRVVDAFRTGSGVYAFQGLPGMREVEAYEGDGVPPDPGSGKKPFIIKVEDNLCRFLPLVFSVDLPLDYRGVYLSESMEPEPESPPAGENLPAFYLFSAPTRTVSPGMTAIHATLVEQASGEPAAYAVMEVEVVDEGMTWYGMADNKGNITLTFPYPLLTIDLDTSPAESIETSLYQQEWELAIRVKYSPADLIYPPGMEIPFFESILEQSTGIIWTDYPEPPAVGTHVNEWSTVLTFGRELILRTAEVEKSELWIDVGTSP